MSCHVISRVAGEEAAVAGGGGAVGEETHSDRAQQEGHAEARGDSEQGQGESSIGRGWDRLGNNSLIGGNRLS